MTKNMINKANKGGVQGRQGLYAYASKYSKEAIDILYLLMTTSKNEGIQLGAAKALLSKSLPDLKATEDIIPKTMPTPIYNGISFVSFEGDENQ